MCDEAEFQVCRLCLSRRGLLMNVFGENSKLQFMLEKTIEDLIDVKVVEDANYPWLVCSSCMDKLTEFRLFKRRCVECLSVFYNRIQKGYSPAREEWITNQEEIVSDAVDKRAVDIPDDMIIVKEEFDTASRCSASPVRDIESVMIASMQEGCSHWSENDEAGNLNHSQDNESGLSFNEEVNIKEECDIDIPQEKGYLGSDLLQKQDNGQKQDDGGTLLHACQICCCEFAQLDHLKDHMMNVHLKKVVQFRCDVCLGIYEHKNDLARHIKLVHALKKKLQCEHCSRNFQHMSRLKTHMTTHTGEKPYKCTLCSKGFAIKSNLKRHILTHTDERLYKCELCSKAFSLKGNLRQHMLTHTGERKHKCEICSKAFGLNSNLKTHMRTHTGTRSFKCHICTRAFTQSGDLKRHIMTHTGDRPHKCNLCSKAFTQSYNLRSHMMTHTEKRS